MSVAAILQALSLPPEVRVDRRVAKKMLMEHGAPTAADKRIIQEGVDEMHWVAALKPMNIGVPAFRDSNRDYGEITVLTVALRSGAKARLTELIHRAIPYPVLLLSSQEAAVTFTVAHKRFSQGEADKVVLDGGVIGENLVDGAALDVAFLASMALSAQTAENLYTLYQGWVDRIEALSVARLTGHFITPESPERASERRTALVEHARLEREIVRLRAQAGKEKQLNRRVELNLGMGALKKELAKVMDRLRWSGHVD
ncbi:MAG: DUF4391 domain-containing protein [Magnetococcales bacterium]|nr:DUF4391 domain-containing protein [Magnetococcales bacterium]